MSASITPEQIHELRHENVGRLLVRAFMDFQMRCTEILQAGGHGEMTSAKLTMMYYLDLEGTRISTLAERAGMTKQSMGDLVRDLEVQGYVVRSPDPSDRRATLIQYSEAGKQFLAAAYAMKEEIDRLYASRLGETGLTDFANLLAQLLGDDVTDFNYPTPQT